MSGGAGEGNSPEVYQPQPGLEAVHEPGLKVVHDQPTRITPKHSRAQPFQARDRREINPLGLGSTMFAALVALLTAIVVGAAVGGGLGRVLASCRANSLNLNSSSIPSCTVNPMSSSTTVSTLATTSQTSQLLSNYTVPAVNTIDSLYSGCPDINDQTYQTSLFQTFTITCGVDFRAGLAADDGGVITDIIGAIMYTLGDCIEACSGFNQQTQRYGRTESCKSVSWSWDLKNATETLVGNCWLKNTTLASGATGIVDGFCISAALN